MACQTKPFKGTSFHLLPYHTSGPCRAPGCLNVCWTCPPGLRAFGSNASLLSISCSSVRRINSNPPSHCQWQDFFRCPSVSSFAFCHNSCHAPGTGGVIIYITQRNNNSYTFIYIVQWVGRSSCLLSSPPLHSLQSEAAGTGGVGDED